MAAFALSCGHYAHVEMGVKRVRCHWCDDARVEVCEPIASAGCGAAIGDIAEHFSETFGMPVRGRKHLRALDKQFGTVEVSPSDIRSSRARALLNGDREAGRFTADPSRPIKGAGWGEPPR